MKNIFSENNRGIFSLLWLFVKKVLARPKRIPAKIDTEKLEFVVLAAGKSTRNYPQSKGLPHKSLVPFGSRKVIDHIMGQIIKAGGKHVTFVVSDEATKGAFEACFRREPDIEDKFARKGNVIGLELLRSTYVPDDMDIKYVYQREPKGTGHAVAQAYKSVRKTGRSIVMIWPDDIFLADKYAFFPEDREPIYRRAVWRYVRDGGRGNLAITNYVKDPSRWGVIADGYYVEKPKDCPSHDAAKGFVIFDPSVCEELLSEAEKLDSGRKVELQGGELTFIPVLNRMIDRNPRELRVRTVQTQPTDIYFDCGTLDGYEKALLYTLLTESEFSRDNIRFIKKVMARAEKYANMKKERRE
ncbi:MAG: hypothetical protein LBT92_03755 [Rickettsiales bacterium]|nr:hypothetical protein [Rickettsiales bacterium]